ncbi:MAG: selenide, water dikinase SelD [Flavobacteriaceae bacterium]|nr:selenide, water dikinase SelD [Flavobacteriaceae bacterium]
MESIKLTSLTKGAGCGCKIAPALLEEVLHGLEQGSFPKLLVGNGQKDDAAVYDLGNGKSLISTVDFFTPVVDDPFVYGQIAAANSLSDVYAMGGKPLLALAVMGFPTEVMNAKTARAIMDGGISKCKEAGIPLAGGHTIESPEPFFGLCVNGLLENVNLKKNGGAKEGDLIFLTKPIGSGILNTAIKRNLIEDSDYSFHIENMLRLNSLGAELAQLPCVNAMTDVTGFALLGHLCEMAEASGLSAELDFAAVPFYPNLEKYLAANCIPDNCYRNWNGYEKKVDGLTNMKAFQLLNDPQTNGGLMVAVGAESLDSFSALIRDSGLREEYCRPIGRFISKKENIIYVLNQ